MIIAGCPEDLRKVYIPANSQTVLLENNCKSNRHMDTQPPKVNLTLKEKPDTTPPIRFCLTNQLSRKMEKKVPSN